MPQNAFFLRTHDLLISPKMMQRHFLFTHHPLSMVIFATATVLAFVLLRNSNFNFHCYTQREAMYTEISLEVRCDLLRLLSRKIAKCIHSSKPASLNRPIDTILVRLLEQLKTMRHWGFFSFFYGSNVKKKKKKSNVLYTLLYKHKVLVLWLWALAFKNQPPPPPTKNKTKTKTNKKERKSNGLLWQQMPQGGSALAVKWSVFVTSKKSQSVVQLARSRPVKTPTLSACKPNPSVDPHRTVAAVHAHSSALTVSWCMARRGSS